MYSQNSEEQYIIEYFNGKVGTFIDIGANDGKTFSNTFALANLGWKGCLVEPSPKAFHQLKQTYFTLMKEVLKSNDGFYFYNFALGETNGLVKMWDSGTHLGKDDHGLLSTMNAEDYNKWRGSTQFTEIEAQCFRWKTFLNRLKLKEFDFISMDCEGNEIAILKQMDLRSTSCACLEWNSKPEVKAEFDKLMIGFKIIYTSSENIIYAR